MMMFLILGLIIIFCGDASSFIVNGLINVNSGHLRCRHCDHASTWFDCHEELCDSNQICFVAVMEFDGAGSLKITAGCRPQSSCRTVNEADHCEHCCNTDNCNRNICGTMGPNGHNWHNGLLHGQQSGGVNYCKTCNGMVMDWNCGHKTPCYEGQVCYIREQARGSEKYYYGGCIAKDHCVNISKTISTSTGALIHGQCCNSRECNDVTILQKQELAAMTTTTPATSSTKTTTHIATTREATTHAVPVTCEVCHGSGCDSGSVRMSQCPLHSPLCMTTVVNDHHGNKVYTKSCASEPECDQKWLKESTAKTECMGYHPNTTYTFNFTCHYCCVTDGCNKVISPLTSTLYVGNTENASQ